MGCHVAARNIGGSIEANRAIEHCWGCSAQMLSKDQPKSPSCKSRHVKRQLSSNSHSSASLFPSFSLSLSLTHSLSLSPLIRKSHGFILISPVPNQVVPPAAVPDLQRALVEPCHTPLRLQRLSSLSATSADHCLSTTDKMSLPRLLQVHVPPARPTLHRCHASEPHHSSTDSCPAVQ